MKLYLFCLEYPNGNIEGFAMDQEGDLVFGESGDSKEAIKNSFMEKPLPDFWDYEKEWVNLDGRKVNHDGLKKTLTKHEKKPGSLSYLFAY